MPVQTRSQIRSQTRSQTISQTRSQTIRTLRPTMSEFKTIPHATNVHTYYYRLNFIGKIMYSYLQLCEGMPNYKSFTSIMNKTRELLFCLKHDQFALAPITQHHRVSLNNINHLCDEIKTKYNLYIETQPCTRRPNR